MNHALRPIASVDDLLHLGPLDRLGALIGGVNFAAYLREEPISFDMHDPIYGYGCGVQGCAQHSTQAAWWCTRHAQERADAVRSGLGEATGRRRPPHCLPNGQRPDGLPVANLSFLHGPGCRR